MMTKYWLAASLSAIRSTSIFSYQTSKRPHGNFRTVLRSRLAPPWNSRTERANIPVLFIAATSCASATSSET